MHLSKKYIFFFRTFLLDFLNQDQILNILNKKMALIAYVFPKLKIS